jgi:hypothetical protein
MQRFSAADNLGKSVQATVNHASWQLVFTDTLLGTRAHWLANHQLRRLLFAKIRVCGESYKLSGVSGP